MEFRGAWENIRSWIMKATKLKGFPCIMMRPIYPRIAEEQPILTHVMKNQLRPRMPIQVWMMNAMENRIAKLTFAPRFGR